MVNNRLVIRNVNSIHGFSPNEPQQQRGASQRWAQQGLDATTRTRWTIDDEPAQQHGLSIVFRNLSR